MTLQSLHHPSVFSAWRREAGKLMAIAWPLSFSYMGQIAIETTDILFIGQLGAEKLAAATLSVTMFFLVFTLCYGIVMAVTPLAAQYLGAYDLRMARRSVRQGLWVALVIGIPGAVFLWHSNLVLEFFGQPEELIPHSTAYMRFFLWGLVPALLFDAVRCFMIALGKSRPAFYLMLAAVLLNIPLDYIFIFGKFGAPEMGLAGAGIASATVNSFLFIGAVIVITTRLPYRRYHLLGNIWRPDWPLFFQIFRLGTPLGLGLMLEQGVYTVSNFIAGLIGTLELAAHGVAMTIVAVTYNFSAGVSEAAAARVGLNHGRGDAAGVRRSGWTAISVILICMGIGGIVYVTLAEQLMRLFLDESTANAEYVITVGAQLILIAALIELFDGTQLVARGALQGISDTTVPMIISGISFWGVGFVGAYGLALVAGFGITGIWFGLCLGLIATTPPLLYRFRKLTRPERLGS